MKAVHFGAGNIGRGFIGQILNKNNFEIVFVDTNNDIINQINSENKYYIEYLDNNKSIFSIDNVRAINLINKDDINNEILNADIITTSIGANNLKNISNILKSSLLHREKNNKSINILANENFINASDLLKEEIIKICSKEEFDKINNISYFVNTSIDRQAISKSINGNNIAVVEPYFEWVIDRSQLDPETPYSLSYVKFVDDLTPFIERKLFIVNAEHAAFAYLGKLFGYKTIQETMLDNRIYYLVKEFLEENIQYFINKYSMKKNDLLDFIDETMLRHKNIALSDPIERVGRAPIRKLGRYDRLVFPVLELQQFGFKNIVGKKIIAAAFLYDDLNDNESVILQEKIVKNGIKDTIINISELPVDTAKEISDIYKSLKSDRNNIFKGGK